MPLAGHCRRTGRRSNGAVPGERHAMAIIGGGPRGTGEVSRSPISLSAQGSNGAARTSACQQLGRWDDLHVRQGPEAASDERPVGCADDQDGMAARNGCVGFPDRRRHVRILGLPCRHPLAPDHVHGSASRHGEPSRVRVHQMCPSAPRPCRDTWATSSGSIIPPITASVVRTRSWPTGS